MAQSLTINGTVYTFPDVGEQSWGQNVTDWAVAVTAGMLQKAGGIFILTADADFGANYGLKAVYLKSRTSNPADAGLLRLAVSDAIGFRNNANSGNLLLAINASDKPTFGGVVLLRSGEIVNADIDAAAAIALSKLAALTASRAVVTDGSGVLSAASVTATELGYLSGILSNVQTQLNDGWVPAGETWTYASASTFTITGDKTGKYQVGDKIKLTQTTDKYFYVVGVSYGAPNTTVTVTGGSDYTVANAAITSPYFSKVENPQGFPAFFNYTPVLTGDNADLSGFDVARFTIHGRKVFLSFYCTGRTLSGSDGAIRITVPVNGTRDIRYMWDCHIYDGTSGNRTAVAAFVPNSGYLTLYGNQAFGNWTVTWLNVEISLDLWYDI